MAIGLQTNSPALVITNNVPAVETNDIRGIKAPIEIPSTWAWLWWLLAGLVLAAVLWWAWRYWRSKKAERPFAIDLIPPHEKALNQLQAALTMLQQPRPFCILVSDTIRTYLEERFSLKAPERTTEEFLDELQASALLALEQKQTLGEFLTRCDLVKFARYEPGEPELRGLYDAAVRLVEETRPAPPLPREGEKAEGEIQSETSPKSRV